MKLYLIILLSLIVISCKDNTVAVNPSDFNGVWSITIDGGSDTNHITAGNNYLYIFHSTYFGTFNNNTFSGSFNYADFTIFKIKAEFDGNTDFREGGSVGFPWYDAKQVFSIDLTDRARWYKIGIIITLIAALVIFNWHL
jgi:hypothetical protein